MGKHRQLTIQPDKLLLELYKKIADVGDVECATVPDVYYSEEHSDPHTRAMEIDVAKTICARCPVLVDCRDYGILAQENYGIWGGLTPLERRPLVKTISGRAS
jgi:Transcription factor WhiB